LVYKYKKSERRRRRRLAISALCAYIIYIHAYYTTSTHRTLYGVVCSIVAVRPTFVPSAVVRAHSIKLNITRGHPAVEAYL